MMKAQEFCMGLRIWGSLISETSSSFEVLLDCAADGEGNEYVIVQLPKNQIIETFLLHSIIQRGQIYGTHSEHTKYAQQQQQESWSKRDAKKDKTKCNSQQDHQQDDLPIEPPVEPLRATHQIWGYIDAEVSLFISNAWGIHSENFKKPREIRQQEGETYQNRYQTKYTSSPNHTRETLDQTCTLYKNRVHVPVKDCTTRTHYKNSTNYGRSSKYKYQASAKTKIPRPKSHPTISQTKP